MFSCCINSFMLPETPQLLPNKRGGPQLLPKVTPPPPKPLWSHVHRLFPCLICESPTVWIVSAIYLTHSTLATHSFIFGPSWVLHRLGTKLLAAFRRCGTKVFLYWETVFLPSWNKHSQWYFWICSPIFLFFLFNKSLLCFPPNKVVSLYIPTTDTQRSPAYRSLQVEGPFAQSPLRGHVPSCQ